LVLPDSCSAIYAKKITTLPKPKLRISLKDVSFLIPVMIDSDDRLKNIYTVINYLKKNFDTNILVWEYGSKQCISYKLLPEGVQLFFEYGLQKEFYRTKVNNKLIEKAVTPFIAIYDTDVILPSLQIIESINLLRDKHADMVYPYDGTFLNMDSLSASIFSKFLEDGFLVQNLEKFITTSKRSFGGCVFLNKKKYCKAGCENVAFTSWGPEDIERYNRMKILGYVIKRVDGPLFHMHHERNLNSGYLPGEARLVFMKEYMNIFNMKKKELQAYVSKW